MNFYEHHKDEIIGGWHFVVRLLRHAGFAILLFAVALGIGIVGFYFAYGGKDQRDLHDAILDASMLLGGMGPVNCGDLKSPWGKAFASAYALFCGIVFVAASGIVLSPVLHRLLHKTFHHRDQTPKDDA